MFHASLRPWRLAVVCVYGLIFAISAYPWTHSQAGIPLVGSDGNPTLAPLMQQVTPAVVNIGVRSRVAIPNNPLYRDPFFRRFFNLPEDAPTRQSVSAGSGVIVDARRGYILTNNHVIENASEILVTLKNQRQFEAELVGRDPGTDIALLKINADQLTALPLANSDNLQVGDFVVAIGNPFGLGQTVTSGIVSALGRSGLNINGYEDLIQTDASINPGNSGGALVNLRGELVGINTAIIAPAGGNIGIGFAVPSNMASAVMNQLISYGEVQRGQLGIIIQSLTPELAQALGVDDTRGAVVTQVGAGTPAEQAGIRPGDIIVAVNGRRIRNSGDLRNRIGLIIAGMTVELSLVREGQRQDLKVRVGVASASLGETSIDKLAGAGFRDNPRGGGVIVSSVERNSPAASYGLQAGDVILAVNRRSVDNIADLRRALAASGNVTTMNIRRGNTELFVVIR